MLGRETCVIMELFVYSMAEDRQITLHASNSQHFIRSYSNIQAFQVQCLRDKEVIVISLVYVDIYDSDH